MHLQQPQQQPQAQPHHSHADPWALNFICCDAPHAASSSLPPSAPPLGSEECCNEPACGPVECCTDPSCAENRCEEAHTAQGGDVGGDELMQWACSKEGCDAIQQYLEYCTQPNCQLPTVQPPSTGLPGPPPMSDTAHYHMLNPMDGISGLGGTSLSSGVLQPPFQPNPMPQQHRRQSSIFDTGVDPVNLQSRPSSSSSHFHQQFQFGHQPPNQHAHQHPTHIPRHPHQHQTLHDHSHAHSHTHIRYPHSHTHQPRQSHTHHASPFRPRHSHSTSISSLPHSALNSPILPPWPGSTGMTPTSSTPVHTPSQMPMQFPTHVCHWSNCHLTFSSMPDLLGHVAADHLGAPGFGPSNPLPPQTPAMFLPQQRQTPFQLQAQHHLALLSSQQSNTHTHSHFSPSILNLSSNPGTSASTPNSTSSIPSLSALAFASPSQSQPLHSQTSHSHQAQSQSQAQSQAQAETDRLLSCLWDDCFPLPTECSADQPDQCPPHTHIPAPSDCTVSHPHSHTHTHRNASGEPFSPQTMLRHVLEEHLGVPSDILGWDSSNADFALEALAAGLNQPAGAGLGGVAGMGRMGGVGGMVGMGGMGGKAGMGGGQLNGLGLGELELPPPVLPSTTGTPLTSPPAQAAGSPPKPLLCNWHDCTHPEPFATPSELMDHLSEVHVGRGRDSYACLWGDCAHACGDDESSAGGEGSGDGDGEGSGSRSGDVGGSGSGSGSRGGEGGSGAKITGRIFRSRQKVLRHLQSHTGYRPYVCPMCNQAFSEAAPLAAHLRRHNEEKPFVCEVEGCGKRFAISSSLTIHMRTHNGDKPFICPHCQKGFVEASNLTKHIRTHTGERPFGCPHPGCGKRFPRPDQLKRHLGVHDKEKTKGGGGAGGKGEGKVGAGKGRGRGKG